MDALKTELRELMQQRDAIEAEIEERSMRLNAPGQPGLHGALLDKEGFPRADVDVHAIRVDRSRIICLSNDHKQLMSKIEALMQQLHAAAREANAVTPGAPRMAANGMNGSTQAVNGTQASGMNGNDTVASTAQPAPALRPFAVVDDVAEASPASTAGIQVGDQLCRFGAAVAGSGSELQAVARELQEQEGRAVQTLWLRHGSPVSLVLVPRRWEGRGLLGCHLRALGS